MNERAAAGRGLAFLREVAQACERCPLAATRTTVVFGVGPPTAALLILGEAPGAIEDAQGAPFVGPAGRRLNAMPTEAGIDRSAAYIANTVMCRPPDDRTPTPTEIAACAPYLDLQLAIVRPTVILALGATATARLLGSGTAVSRARGLQHQTPQGVVVPTYHPSGLNRSPTRATLAAADLRVAAAVVGAIARATPSDP